MHAKINFEVNSIILYKLRYYSINIKKDNVEPQVGVTFCGTLLWGGGGDLIFGQTCITSFSQVRVKSKFNLSTFKKNKKTLNNEDVKDIINIYAKPVIWVPHKVM